MSAVIQLLSSVHLTHRATAHMTPMSHTVVVVVVVIVSVDVVDICPYVLRPERACPTINLIYLFTPFAFCTLL